MTVSTTANRVHYTGNGVTQDFAFPFKVLENADMTVYFDGVQQNNGFTTTGAGADAGNVHFATAPANNVLVVLVRAQPYTQETVVAPSGPFPAKTVETMADKAMIAAQQTLDTELLAVRANPGDASVLGPLPMAPARADRLIAFDAFGQPIASSFTQTQLASAIAAAYVGAAGPLSALSFLQAGAAAVSRNAQDKDRDTVSVKDYGALGNGIADDTAAFNACVTYCIASRRAMYMPGGVYNISSVPIAGRLRVYGDGYDNTVVVPSGAVGFDVSTEQSVTFAAFRMNGAGAGKIGIRLDGPAPYGNAFSLLRDVYLYNFEVAFDTLSAYAWVADNVVVDGYTVAGMRVRNALNADAGDSQISACKIVNGSGGASVAIDHRSSGGLRVIGNKLNVGAYGYRFSADAGAVTSVLVLASNSIENCSIAAVQITNSHLDAQYGLITIIGNEIALSGYGILVNPSVAKFLGNISVLGNTINVSAPGTNGMAFTYTSSVIVEGNVVIGDNTPGQVGISYAATVAGKHGTNMISGFPAGSQISNAGGVYMTKQRPQDGAVAVTCATPYAAIYYGSAAVVFPSAYDVAPQVRTSESNVSGYVSCWPSAISTTGFTMNVLSITNGGAGNALWFADGQ